MVRIQDIPTFCVNLEKSTERWEQIQKQADVYKINVQRWNASKPEDTESIPFIQNLTGAQKGCAHSHIRLWEHAIKEGYEYLFVLEDDALFRNDWIDVINERLETIDSIDSVWDSIFLNCSEEITPYNTWQVIKRQAMTAGYIIRRHAIEYLLHNYRDRWACADWMTQVLQERGHSYSIFPWLIIQDGSPSSIQENNSPDYEKVLRLLNEANYSISNYSLKESRISWKEYFSELSKLVSKRSPCSRLHVGCVFVIDNHIISTGYNGFLPGAKHTSIVVDGHEQATVHAEQNCIADCAKRGVNMNGAEVYITHYPCLNCFKIMAASGVKKIFYLEDYNNSPIIDQLSKETSISIEKL